MAITIAYNKIALQGLEKALKIRVSALPTIRSKESALRTEVKKIRRQLDEYFSELDAHLKAGSRFGILWAEWDPELVTVRQVVTTAGSFAGVRFREFGQIDLVIREYDFRSNPGWWPEGVRYVQKGYDLQARLMLKKQQVNLLEKERKKTTQKLNLYEKVQIPEFQEGIRKIKRFLEDQETLEKATQKIVKKKKQVV